MQAHKTVSREEWLEARRALLAKEKAVLKQQDALAAERRAMPWVKVERSYVFDGPDGKVTLDGLFDGRSQLIIDHFMLGPGWEEGCVGCSFGADHIEGGLIHLEHHDVTVVVVSRAPLAEIEAFKRRMDWRFKWVSSYGSDFNFDFGVSFTPEDEARNEVTYNYAKQPYEHDELPGISVFVKDDAGAVFHTYSTYRRGVEAMMGTYSLIDLTPKGRDEGSGEGMAWVRHHDRYETAGASVSCCHSNG